MSKGNTYRAAYWTDGHDDVCLTTEDDQHLPDDELIASALLEAAVQGLVVADGKIVIGDWIE